MTIFSFPLTWTFLGDFPDPKSLERRKPECRAVPFQAVAEASEQWEMVIPKMERPPQRTAITSSKLAAAPQVAPPSFCSAAESRLLSNYRVVLGGLLLFAVLVAGGIAAYEMNPPSTPKKSLVVAGSALPVGVEGWTTSPAWPRQISILRGSTGLTDFRLEFKAGIGSKALGWVFRAQDFKNFYAAKLEILKSGAQPVVALKRFAVIDGRDQPVNQILLPLPVRLDTVYNVRLDALGNKFSISILGRTLDEWTDNRLMKGGVGWYAEFGERADMQSELSVYPLVVK